MNPTLVALSEAGAVDALDRAFAEMLARRVPELPEPVLLGAALASRAPTKGHAAVRLSDAADMLAREHEPDAAKPLPALPALATWKAALRSCSPVVRTPTEARPTPLVLDGERLYLDRVWRNEAKVAAWIRARATQLRDDVDRAALRAGLDALFPPSPGASEPDLQRLAAETALSRGFTVIAGGPGTGKTSTVVRIIALLAHQARRQKSPPPRVVLLAPTGKAAARLTESIRLQRDRLPEAFREGITDEARTIHRALGVNPTLGADQTFEPIQADLVVVDESSMVDQSLMAALLGSISEDARVVLLGDPDQLASVEHGSVLGDVCAATGPVAEAVVRLKRAWRFGKDSGIARLAAAIHADDADQVLAILDEPAYPDVTRVEAMSRGPRRLEAVLREDLVAAHAAVRSAVSPLDALRALNGFRVLCAHRRGAWGADALNPRLAALLERAGVLTPEDPFYPGQPVMVLENDDRSRLYNGDTGLVRADAGGRLRVWFPGATEDDVRDFAPERLPDVETVFASTVHKSQGSEYGRVAVVLPDKPSPVLTRELLYTAVTRASRSVLVIGGAEVIRAAVAARTVRVTGLVARLGG